MPPVYYTHTGVPSRMPRLSRDEEQARARLEALAAELAHGVHADLPPLTVRLSARLTRSAGTYRPPGTITLSRHFLRDRGFEATVEILRHEVAHHAVRWTARGRVRPHGPEFLAAAAALEAPRRAPAFRAPRLVHAYRCPVCGWTWLRGRRLRRSRRYACARCAPQYDERFRLRYAGTIRSDER